MRFHTLQGWLDWLESCHPSNAIELGLDRISQVAARLEIYNALAQSRVITVAGTNGKGSCVAALNALLRSSDLHVGCYTSPHFIHYNERIVVDDRVVTEALLIESFERVDQAREQVELTYFEFGTLVALDIFARSELDVVILEVGLGGRLDAVNIIDSDIAVITSIDIDHEQWLGSDRETIAREKAGIFRCGKPALCADVKPPSSIAEVAEKVGASLYQRGYEFDLIANADGRYCWQSHMSYQSQWLNSLMLPVGSVAAALQALVLLEIPVTASHLACLQSLRLPGRFQTVENTDETGQLILDVAHNRAAAQLLAKRLAASPVKGRTLVLTAMMKDKDCDGVIDALKAGVDAWFLADLNNTPRAMSASDLAIKLSEHDILMISVGKNIRQAYRHACSLMEAQDRLVVMGSFITVSEVMKILQCDSDSGCSNE